MWEAGHPHDCSSVSPALQPLRACIFPSSLEAAGCLPLPLPRRPQPGPVLNPPLGSLPLLSLSSLSSSSCASSFSGPASFLCASWQATPGTLEFRLSSKPFAPLWRAPPLTGREQLEWIAGKGGGCSCRDARVLPGEKGTCTGQAALLRKGIGWEEALVDKGLTSCPPSLYPSLLWGRAGP